MAEGFNVFRVGKEIVECGRKCLYTIVISGPQGYLRGSQERLRKDLQN